NSTEADLLGILGSSSARTRTSASPADRHLRQARERRLLRGRIELAPGPTAVQVVVVRLHVEMAVTRESDQDHALLTRLTRGDRLVDSPADRVRRLRRGDDSLRL